MDVLNIPYVDVEDEFMAYTDVDMIRKEVHETLTPYQMVRFFVNFKIRNITIWSNLTFEQTKHLFKNLRNTKKMPTYATKKTNLPNVNLNNVTSTKALPSATMGSKTKIDHQQQITIDTMSIQSLVYPHNKSMLDKPLARHKDFNNIMQTYLFRCEQMQHAFNPSKIISNLISFLAPSTNTQLIKEHKYISMLQTTKSTGYNNFQSKLFVNSKSWYFTVETFCNIFEIYIHTLFTPFLQFHFVCRLLQLVFEQVQHFKKLHKKLQKNST